MSIINILMTHPQKYRQIAPTKKFRHRSYTPELCSVAKKNSSSGKNPKDERKFFDIDYIFNQPVLKRQRNNYHTINTTSVKGNPFKRHKKFFDSEQSQEEYDASKNIYKGTIIKGKTPLSKFNLMFQENSDGISIHNRRNASSHMSRSTPTKELNITIENDSCINSDLALGISCNGASERKVQSREDKKRSKPRQYSKRIEIIDPEQTWLSQQKIKKTLLDSPEFKKYYEKGAAWVKNALVMRNKQTIRIYRPWSPLHLDKEDSFNQQGILF